MINVSTPKKTVLLNKHAILMIASLSLLVFFTNTVFAEGIFEDKKKS